MFTREEKRAGFGAAALAYVIWGVLPLYLHLVGFATPWEILAQRILWSLPAAALLLAVVGGWRDTFAALRRKNLLKMLIASSVFVAANWALYVWAVGNNQVIEASLAYFLSPLVGVALGVVLFKEPLGKGQALALALAGAGVVVEGFALGTWPWLSLLLCATWSTYALIRKQAQVPAAGGLMIETLLLSPFAAGALWFMSQAPGGLAFTQSWTHGALLAASGIFTAAPLILFAFGARRLMLSTMGLLQFIAPSLQFLIGALGGEPVTPLRLVGFGLIWLGLAAFSWEAVARERGRLALAETAAE